MGTGVGGGGAVAPGRAASGFGRSDPRDHEGADAADALLSSVSVHSSSSAPTSRAGMAPAACSGPGTRCLSASGPRAPGGVEGLRCSRDARIVGAANLRPESKSVRMLLQNPQALEPGRVHGGSESARMPGLRRLQVAG